ncbi:MAG: alpha/beta hydrolase [Candidatus Heimdallarchaeota archaeon]
MTGNDSNTPFAEKKIVYTIPGAKKVRMKKNVQYGGIEAPSLLMDLYYPSDVGENVLLPVVIFVSGYSMERIVEMTGRKFKDIAQYTSWGKLIAQVGFIGITYDAKQPERDITALLNFINKNAPSLGINHEKICLWSCSANSLLAISLLMQAGMDDIESVVIYYGILFDQELEQEIAELTKEVGSVYPSTLKQDDLKLQKIPVLIVRAGQDQSAVLNRSIDLFLARLIDLNYPVQFINYSRGQHGFDVLDDYKQSRDIIKTTLAFIKDNFRE